MDPSLSLHIIKKYGRVLEKEDLYFMNEEDLPCSKSIIKEAIKTRLKYLIEENIEGVPEEEFKALIFAHAALDNFIPKEIYYKFKKFWEIHKDENLRKEFINSNKDLHEFIKNRKLEEPDDLTSYIEKIHKDFNP